MFTTHVLINYTDEEVRKSFKAEDKARSTRQARKWIRGQGLSIKDSVKEETKRTLRVNFEVDSEAPVPEAPEDEVVEEVENEEEE